MTNEGIAALIDAMAAQADQTAIIETARHDYEIHQSVSIRQAGHVIRGIAEELRAKKTEKRPKKSGIPVYALCFFRDGDQWCCVFGDFVNLQESPAGFGDGITRAADDLYRQMKNEKDDTA